MDGATKKNKKGYLSIFSLCVSFIPLGNYFIPVFFKQSNFMDLFYDGVSLLLMIAIPICALKKRKKYDNSVIRILLCILAMVYICGYFILVAKIQLESLFGFKDSIVLNYIYKFLPDYLTKFLIFVWLILPILTQLYPFLKSENKGKSKKFFN